MSERCRNSARSRAAWRHYLAGYKATTELFINRTCRLPVSVTCRVIVEVRFRVRVRVRVKVRFGFLWGVFSRGGLFSATMPWALHGGGGSLS